MENHRATFGQCQKAFCIVFCSCSCSTVFLPAWARGHFRAHPSGQQQNIVSFPINRQATTLRRGGCFALALGSSSSGGSKSCGNVFRFGYSFFAPPLPHPLIQVELLAQATHTIHERSAHTFPARVEEKLHVSCPLLMWVCAWMSVCYCVCLCVHECVFGGCYWLVFDFIDFHKAAFTTNFATRDVRALLPN